jgi:branched-chain amino acid aminotransferase
VLRSKANPNNLELITAPLTDRIILDGVTRRSVLELARTRLSSTSTLPDKLAPLTVHERQITMAEVSEAYAEGRLVEAFAAGTAWFVAGVSEIEWKGDSIKMEVDEDGCGVYAALLKGWLKNIMYGKERHEWGYVVEEEQSSA